MITVEQVQEKMIELFGDKVVNPEHYPKQFEYQVKLAKWMLQTEPSTNQVVVKPETGEENST